MMAPIMSIMPAFGGAIARIISSGAGALMTAVVACAAIAQTPETEPQEAPGRVFVSISIAENAVFETPGLVNETIRSDLEIALASALGERGIQMADTEETADMSITVTVSPRLGAENIGVFGILPASQNTPAVAFAIGRLGARTLRPDGQYSHAEFWFEEYEPLGGSIDIKADGIKQVNAMYGRAFTGAIPHVVDVMATELQTLRERQ